MERLLGPSGRKSGRMSGRMSGRISGRLQSSEPLGIGPNRPGGDGERTVIDPARPGATD